MSLFVSPIRAYESIIPPKIPPVTWFVGVFVVPAPIKTCKTPPVSVTPILVPSFPSSIFGPAPVLPMVTTTSFLSL